MKAPNMQLALPGLCLLFALYLTGCKTSTAPAGTDNTTTSENARLSPQRVDIRGSIISSHYDQGQVMLEIEGFPSQDSRYNRAYVLVLPTTQIINKDGQPSDMVELRPGVNVAVLLRGGGRGNFVGMGIARKVWIEDTF
ncbi:hypothetical protein [Pontibacter ruber]|uniref:DUF3465 domain-containing protein n=1 Tax=Pontibacter ruber TaxID=1343895 RepID=A0ABW5D0E4_9BACT|nr:hypothetical protein [Pontibacter ruber]